MNELRAFVSVSLAPEESLDKIHSEERHRISVRLFLRGVNLVRPGVLLRERQGTACGAAGMVRQWWRTSAGKEDLTGKRVWPLNGDQAWAV